MYSEHNYHCFELIFFHQNPSRLKFVICCLQSTFRREFYKFLAFRSYLVCLESLLCCNCPEFLFDFIHISFVILFFSREHVDAQVDFTSNVWFHSAQHCICSVMGSNLVELNQEVFFSETLLKLPKFKQLREVFLSSKSNNCYTK